MHLSATGKVLGCESKTNKTGGQYFMVLIGGEGWGHKFYSKDFIEPNAKKEIQIHFNYEQDKLFLDTDILKATLKG